MIDLDQYSRPKTLTLIHFQMKDKTRHARGPLRTICDIDINASLDISTTHMFGITEWQQFRFAKKTDLNNWQSVQLGKNKELNQRV